MANAPRQTSEKTIRKAWERYNETIDKQIDKAAAQGRDIGWQWDRLETYAEFVAAYRAQKISNRYYKEMKRGKEYKGKENITRQLVAASHTWTRPIIYRYKKEKKFTTVAEAETALQKTSRQQLFDYFLELNNGDYDYASAGYQSLINNITIDVEEVKRKREERKKKKDKTRRKR